MLGSLLDVDVTGATLRHAPSDIADWKRWRLTCAVRRAAPLAGANTVGQAIHDPHSPQGPKGEIPLGLPPEQKDDFINSRRKNGRTKPQALHRPRKRELQTCGYDRDEEFG
jgi:hypothetical protein